MERSFAQQTSKFTHILGALAALTVSSTVIAAEGDFNLRDYNLLVGAAAVSLDADDSIVISGGIGPRYAQGQEGQLRAVAIVIQGPETNKVAIVGCDVLFTPADIVDPALEDIERTTGIPAANVLVNATHTHHAPSTSRIHGCEREEIFCRRLQDAIVESVQQADAAATDQHSQFLFHLGEEQTVGANSRLLLAIVIGDVAIVGVPAEYFTSLGVDIKRRSPFRHTYIAELANDWIGYLPDREGHQLGGYQTWMGLHSYAEIGTGEKMADAVVDMLRELGR